MDQDELRKKVIEKHVRKSMGQKKTTKDVLKNKVLIELKAGMNEKQALAAMISKGYNEAAVRDAIDSVKGKAVRKKNSAPIFAVLVLVALIIFGVGFMAYTSWYGTVFSEPLCSQSNYSIAINGQFNFRAVLISGLTKLGTSDCDSFTKVSKYISQVDEIERFRGSRIVNKHEKKVELGMGFSDFEMASQIVYNACIIERWYNGLSCDDVVANSYCLAEQVNSLQRMNAPKEDIAALRKEIFSGGIYDVNKEKGGTDAELGMEQLLQII